MKNSILVFLLLISVIPISYSKETQKQDKVFFTQSPQLTQEGAFELVRRVKLAASKINKIVTIAILDSAG